jgi:hypothetical protein
MWPVAGEDLARRVRGAPLLEGQGIRWYELELCSRARPDDGPALHLRPQGVALAVIHHEVALVEFARGAEIEHRAGDSPLEDDARVAERAKRDGDGKAAHDVIDDLVPHEDLQRIGTRIVLDLQGQHRFLSGEPRRRHGWGNERRLVDGRDTVGWGAARDEFMERH